MEMERHASPPSPCSFGDGMDGLDGLDGLDVSRRRPGLRGASAVASALDAATEGSSLLVPWGRRGSVLFSIVSMIV